MKLGLRTRPSLEVLEDRTCPTLTVKLLPGGTLSITGVPNGVLNVTQTAPNTLMVVDDTMPLVVGGENPLGTYVAPANLLVKVNRFNDAICVDLNGLNYSGNIVLDVGLGGRATVAIVPEVTVFSSLAGGTMRGNLTMVNGSGQEQYFIGAAGTAFCNPTPGVDLPINVLGNATVVGKASLAAPGDSLNVVPGSLVGGTLSVTQIEFPTVGDVILGGATVGGSVSMSNVSGRLFIPNLFGTVGRNVSISGPLAAFNNTLTIGGPVAGLTTQTTINGSVSVRLGDSTGLSSNIFEFGDGSTIGGNLTFTTGAGDDTVNLNGTVAGFASLNLGAGNDSFTLSATGSVFGYLNLFGGNGDESLTVDGAVSGTALVNLGNGANTITYNAAPGGQLTVRAGNGGSTLNLGNGDGDSFLVDVLFGNGDDTVNVDLGSGTLSGKIDGGGRLVANLFNLISGTLAPTFQLSNFP